MVKEITQNTTTLYQCEECGLKYRDKSVAEKCETWCRKHKSCNLEIIQFAEKENG